MHNVFNLTIHIVLYFGSKYCNVEYVISLLVDNYMHILVLCATMGVQVESCVYIFVSNCMYTRLFLIPSKCI